MSYTTSINEPLIIQCYDQYQSIYDKLTTTLEADQLERLMIETNPDQLSPTKIWNIPYEYNFDFTGRETYLVELEKRLNERHTTALTQPQAIHGLGGIGKTQIALKYVYDHRDCYQLVWWLRAEEPSTLAADFAALAQKLNLPQQHAPDQEIVIEAVKTWLATAKNWLLIFDNAPDQASVYPYLLQRGHTIITTRNHYWTNVATLAIKEMAPTEAYAFLVKTTRLTDKKSALQLVEALVHLPLALAQAAAYIKKHRRTYTDYLALFEKHQTNLLAHEFNEKAYPATVATTWLISFEQIQIENPQAFDLLYCFAYFVPDNIQISFLAQIANKLPASLACLVADELKLDETLSLLQQYALIDREEDQITIHRLVQTVSQDQLDAVSVEITSKTIASLLSQIADYLKDQVRYADSQAYAEQALTIREQVLGSNHPYTATSLNDLALLLRIQGDYAAAKPLYEQALAIREQVLGSDHPHTATSLNDLALLLRIQGDYAAAKPLYEQALAIRKQVLGSDHPDTATSLNNLAFLFCQQEKYDTAKPLVEQALAIREQVLGSNHPDTLTSLNNLASLLYGQEDYAAAKPLYEQALAIRKQVLGSNHPHTAQSLNDLALLIFRQGDYATAKPLYEQALAIKEQVLGPNHPFTATSLHNLAALHRRQGDYAAAKPLFERALAIREQVLGPDHPDTKNMRDSLASLGKESV